MKLKKSAKNHKNEKTQHLMGCFKSKEEFKINFCLFLAYFEQKVAKNMFFVIFKKTVSFGQNLTLPMYFSGNFLSENVYFYVLS